MIQVYFENENGSHCELMAIFKDEYLYDKCIEALENEAKSQGLILTESIEH